MLIPIHINPILIHVSISEQLRHLLSMFAHSMNASNMEFWINFIIMIS